MTRRQYQALVYFIHFVAVAVTLILVVWLMPGFQLETSWLGLIFVTAVFALLTTIVKPAIEYVLSPLTIAFYFIFAIALNTLMLYLTELLTDGIFSIDNIFWAILGGQLSESSAGQ